jgi:histidine triad (HIT) family protein
MAVNKSCIFCDIVARSLSAPIVFEDEVTLAFLDHRPLFPGHTLLVPKKHFETLGDLPGDLIKPFFKNAQLLALAVEQAMEAEGSFVAMNNRVSQSVPHLHLHLVPRRKGDGLKGFFWPRRKYESEEHIHGVAEKIRAALPAMNK